MKAYKTVKITNAIGDHLAATPLFRVLKNKGLNVRVCCILPEILQGNKNIDEFVKPNKDLMSKAPNVYKFGFEKGLYMKLSEIWCKIYDVDLDEDKLDIFIPNKEEVKAREYLAQFKKPVIVIAPYGGGAIKQGKTVHITNNKDWVEKYWVKLIGQLKRNYTVIQVGVAGEKVISNVDRALMGMPLLHIAAILKHSHTFISVDTLLQHMGNAVGKKGVVLFGRSDPYMFGHSSNINLHSKCNMQICHKNNSIQAQWNIDLIQCKDRVCIENIKPDDVLEAIKVIK